MALAYEWSNDDHMSPKALKKDPQRWQMCLILVISFLSSPQSDATTTLLISTETCIRPFGCFCLHPRVLC